MQKKTKKKISKSLKGSNQSVSTRTTSKAKPTEPYRKLLINICNFLNDIQCIQDMFELVIPDLRDQDKKNMDEINRKLKLLNKKIAKNGSQNQGAVIHQVYSLVRSIQSLNRADIMFRSHALVCIVSRYDHYLSDLLKNAYRKNPERAISNEKMLTYEDLLSLDSLDNLIELFISKEIDTLLHEAHDKQLGAIDKEFKLGVIDNFDEFPTFVEMTERRNLFVHGGGIVTRYYLRRCKEVNYQIPPETKLGITLSVSEKYFGTTINCMYDLGVRLGFALACRLYPDRLEEIHDNLLNNVGFPLLQSENWEMARRVFNFALTWPDKYIPDDKTRRYYIANKALALNHLNRHQEALECLSEYDWSSQSDKMLLAVSVLRHKWKQAEQIMSRMQRDEPFSEEDYRTWPIFKEFRATKEFRRAYRKVYGKRFVVRLSKSDVKKLEKLTQKRDG